MLENLLHSAADPAALVGSAGGVRWANAAYERLAARAAPTPVLDDRTLAAIRGTVHFGTYEVQITVAGTPLVYTAVTIDVGSGDPDSTCFLVILTATASPQSKLVAKEELLAAVAHDLRNPLGAIFSYADALLDTSAGEGMAASHREILRRIRSTASRSVDLILNYQLLARIQSKGVLRPSAPIDLNQSVRSVIDHAWREDSHSAPLVTELHQHPLPVLLERVQVERALANVLTNAFKYTPQSGRISVKTFPQDRYAVASVNNTGTNINQAEIAGLFARYQRASTSAGKGGSGLGLFIVKTIMNTCGGKVELNSSAKDGVTFSLFFPLASTSAVTAAQSN